jgi:HlyD family secretion protein
MMRRIILIILFLMFAGAGLYYVFFERASKVKDSLVLYGNVDVRQVNLGFRVMGRVIDMPWQEGDFVKQGGFMARIDTQPYADQVQQAEAALEANKFQLANARTILKRRQDLISTGSVSQEDLDNALSTYEVSLANTKQSEANLGVTKTNIRDTELFAPNDGTILTRIREPGTVVREADPIYTLSLISPVWVRAYISEPDLGLIYPGMPAEILTDTPQAPTYQGHVGFISPVAEFTPKTVETTKLRTDLVYRLRIITDNPDSGLRQGMPVTVKLKLKSNPEKKSGE